MAQHQQHQQILAVASGKNVGDGDAAGGGGGGGGGKTKGVDILEHKSQRYIME